MNDEKTTFYSIVRGSADHRRMRNNMALWIKLGLELISLYFPSEESAAPYLV